ncbi:MAG: flavodoxin [Spirochaetes bacterium DG_61]|jgi:NAD(P)H dehydrogenase (quinone)|nr:MAG: flavodoxin [Spirochaetes bacterium DG_61]
MPKTAIIYDSVGNNVKRMAEILLSEFQRQNTPCELFFVEQFPVERMTEYDGFVIGTPNYFGGMTSKIKKLVDDSVKHYKKLDGKLGAAFCSTGIIGGGGETAIMDVIKAMLIHGMVVQGSPETGHYGVLAIGKPDARAEKELKIMAQRFIALLNRLAR